MTSPVVTLIDLIRHGEPVGGKRYRGGGVDDPLSEKGWGQMRTAVGEHHPWQHIVSSPMRRCAEFANELGGRWKIPVAVEERFREVAFGAWEGKTAQEINQSDPHRIRNFRLDPESWRPEGAEALDAFAARVQSGWEALLERHSGSHVLVVAHAGVIRMTLALAMGIPKGHIYRIQVGNAGLSRIKVEGDGAERLVTLEFHGGAL